MLTDDITRLCGEINMMRRERSSLMREVRRDTRNRKQAVMDMCVHFENARTAMASRTKNERVAFLNGMKYTVNNLQRATREDLAGARRAWTGRAA